MPITDARKRANEKYIKEKTDELKIRVEKGEKLNFQEHAKLMNESLNGFVNRAMQEQMKRDKEKLDQNEKATQCD